MARAIIGTIAAMVSVVVLGGLMLIYSGTYNVAATEPHWTLTHWIVGVTKLRSIKAHAAGISAPPNLSDDGEVAEGIEHFAAHCVICHGAPGVPRGDIALRLYPSPPDLTGVSETYGPGELFWIVKNGIKATGMPAWRDHSDDELWTIVAFLRKLPAISAQGYASQLTVSTTSGGHHHHADADRSESMLSTLGSIAEHDHHHGLRTE
jgi:mono/diheme cytochrome c family protein